MIRTYDKLMLDDANYDLSIGGYEYYLGYCEDGTFLKATHAHMVNQVVKWIIN